MNELEVRQLFRNMSDCYADTRTEKEDKTMGDDSLNEGEVIQAITEETFMKIILQLPIVDISFRLENNIELLKFANWFCNNCKECPTGVYTSEGENYKIKYLDEILDYVNNKRNTGARIGHTSGIIEMDRTFVRSECVTPDFVFFLTLWCIVCKEVVNIDEADRITTAYYLKTNRSKKNLLVGFVELLRKTETEHNLQRVKTMQNTLVLAMDIVEYIDAIIDGSDHEKTRELPKETNEPTIDKEESK